MRGAVAEFGGFKLRVALGGMGGGSAQSLGCSLHLAGRFVVHGHLACNIGFAAFEELGQPLGDAHMPLRAARGGLILIEDFAVNLVSKHIEGRARAAWQLVFAGAFDKVKVASQGIAGLSTSAGSRSSAAATAHAGNATLIRLPASSNSFTSGASRSISSSTISASTPGTSEEKLFERRANLVMNGAIFRALAQDLLRNEVSTMAMAKRGSLGTTVHEFVSPGGTADWFGLP